MEPEDSLKFIPLIQPGGTEEVRLADELLGGMSRHDPIADRLREGTTRRDFAMVAANITQDRYSAGSSAARATLIILLRHGLEAAKEFLDDLGHHEN